MWSPVVSGRFRYSLEIDRPPHYWSTPILLGSIHIQAKQSQQTLKTLHSNTDTDIPSIGSNSNYQYTQKLVALLVARLRRGNEAYLPWIAPGAELVIVLAALIAYPTVHFLYHGTCRMPSPSILHHVRWPQKLE
jgi:hypothetical protein